MKEWKSKNKYKFWHSPIMLITLFLLVIIFAYNMIDLIQKERETNKNKVSELNKIDELRARESSLDKDIKKLNTNEGIEEAIRDKFQVVKPNEKMVIIVDDDGKYSSSTEQKIDHSFWGFIKRMFGAK